MATMTISQTIQKALNILDAQDWYYSMVDYGYEAAYKSAKANMRYFVEVTDTLPGDLRSTLRNLWIATCAYMKEFTMFHRPSDEEEKAYMNVKEEAMAILNPLIA